MVVVYKVEMFKEDKNKILFKRFKFYDIT